MGELVAKAQYFCSIKYSTNWYWGEHPLQQAIIFPTRTIIHPHLDVVGITGVQDIPKSVCNRIQAKIHTKTYYFLKDVDYDSILDVIERQEKIILEVL